MSEFLKSAMGYFNTGTNGGGDDFIGMIVEVGSIKLRVKRVIAEGKLGRLLANVKLFFSELPRVTEYC